MRFACISTEKAFAPVATLCRVLEVTRSGYYAWLVRGPSDHAANGQKLALEIAAIHKASGETYGSPRVHAELLAKGFDVMLDRLLHHAHVLKCGPRSYRTHRAGLSDPAARE